VKPAPGRPLLQLLAVSFAAALLFSVLGAGCGGAKYPNCDNDQDCNAGGHTGVCVNGKCVACRDDAGCGKGKECKAGQCEAIVDYCDDSHPCSGTCNNHRCTKVAPHDPTACDDQNPCGAGEHCQNGHCVAPPHGGPGCVDFPAPKYAYESPDLTEDAKKTVQRLAACLTTGTLKGAHVLLVGHCDARGEYEFNMGLGAERAEGARKLLMGLGVPGDVINTTSRGKLDATGNDEAGWANDRRVDIEIR
jgi:peptidoglycan-associated lipoprotein